MEQILPSRNAKISTMKITEGTKKRIDHLKVYPRETYEEILIRILDVLNTARQSPEKARSKLVMIEKQRRMNFKERE
ncbi:MAG: hypothetical protein AABX66_03485 [Nanoarchaeota archaeon]